MGVSWPLIEQRSEYGILGIVAMPMNLTNAIM